MKIAIKVPKPRNPTALPVRERKAGAHKSDNPARQVRHSAKNDLRLYLLGRKEESG